MPEVASQTLDLVGRELTATLGEARAALETYVEQPDNVSLLERCKQELHQVHGVLRVLEIYGAALLAEEMEQVAGYLLATVTERKGQAESLDALLRAMVQLPGYLERVLAGGRDLALVLLPLLNDLRAVRGSPLLSEGTLLLLNLKSDKQAQPVAASADEPPLNIEQWSRRLRARFQIGLIGWIRGERIEQNLETLAAVAQKLEQTATRQPVFQLWWVVGAVIEALRENGLEGGQSIKRLLGLADREIRRLYELGEARYSQTPPVELLNNLLYYVGRAECSGTRVSRGARLLPPGGAAAGRREHRAGAREPLGAERQAHADRRGGHPRGSLEGEGRPRHLRAPRRGPAAGARSAGRAAAQDRRHARRARAGRAARHRAGADRASWRRSSPGRLRADETTLVEIAAALIGVEDRLDDGLVGMILPRPGAEPAQEDHEFQQVQSAVLRECILNLARIKESVTQSVGGTLDAGGLDSWQELMRGLKAALLLLGKTRAVEVIEAITTQLKRVMQPGALALPSGFLDRLADAIVSVEYYMETLQAGRSDPWYMLDNALACVQALEQQQSVGVPTVPPLEPSSFAKTVQIPASLPLDATHVADVASTAPDLGEQSPPVVTASSAARLAALAENADPELVKLFIEEAREELVKIERGFPVWDQNPLEREALVTVRRSFHTLKGSGRMVGARELGELAWAVENLLNRVLDNTLTRSPAILEVLRDGIAALPQMIDHLEKGSPVAADVAGIAARAHALASGRQPPSTARTVAAALSRETALAAQAPPAPTAEDSTQLDLSSSAVAEPAGSPAPAAQPTPMDEALREIYARETSAHVATIRHYLKREAQHPEPHLLPEDVYRACHTLAGSSKMAQARHGVRIAEPIDHWLRRAYTSGIGLRSAELTLLADCMAAMESVAANLDEPTGYFVNHWQLLDRLGQAERALDARIAEASRIDAASPSLPAAETRVTPAEPAAPEPLAPPAASVAAVASAMPAAFPTSEATAAPASEHVEPEVQPEPAPDESPDFDPEVAAIFTEEALELIDASEHALSEWRDKPGNPESATALKRPLHTLKGGARMAGILAMGDLSHELETLVIHAEGGTVAVDGSVFDVIQASLDELARMRESVASGRRVAPARAMIGRIQGLTRPGGSAAASAQPAAAAPKQEQPAPVAETAVPVAAAVPRPAEEASVSPSLGDEALETAAEAELAEPPVLAAAPELEPWPGLDAMQQAPVLSPAPPPAAYEAAPPAEDGEFPALESAPPEMHATEPAPEAAAETAAEAAADEVLAAPLPVPPGREPVAAPERQEMARVDAELLDKLLNISGEASIARSRLEQQLGSIDFNLGELSRTVTRLKEQLRSLEIETEAQILHRHEDEGGHRSEFDPLELDRYSSIQQFSRALAETANDVASIQQLLENLAKDAQNLLQQQARTITELQNGLMRTRMVPFQRHVQRLARIVRQAASDTGKRAELVVEGASGELDRQVLERMLPPFEHMLRNAVVHGIESPEERTRRGKPPAGRILLEIHREGAEVMVRLTDDGAGMNLEAIRAKGRALGLIPPGRALSDEDAMQLILEPGFSTAGALTQQAGRGVGMDVVATEIKRLGGALHMETKAGEGSVFTIRLPFTLAISHALVVRTGEEFYALPLPTVEGVLRLTKAEVSAHLGRDAAMFDHGGQKYRFQHLAVFVGLEPAPLPEQDVTIPVVLVRAGEHSTGLVADELVGSREIVVKSVGPQISSIRGISGATILGDGRIVIILDIGALVRAEWRGRAQLPTVPREKEDRRTFALVVDDSITVRRVTQRLLERNGMRVLTARDGMDAIALLQDHVPDIILLDIEMPRMDGYEVAAHVRNDSRLKDVPIIMITSRVGEKHRARAIELGVDDYLGKPYQEAELLDAIGPLVERRRAALESALQDVPRQAEG